MNHQRMIHPTNGGYVCDCGEIITYSNYENVPNHKKETVAVYQALNHKCKQLDKKKDYKIVMIAALLGVVFGLNNLVGYVFIRGYTPFPGIWGEDEILYAAKIHYFSLTNQLSSIFTYTDAIPIIVFGYINKYASVDMIFLAAPFIFIPILFYTVYKFCQCQQTEANNAVIILAAIATISLTQFKNLIQGGDYGMISYFQRFPQVMFSGIFFFYALKLISKTYYNKAKKHDITILGVLSGAMLYVYFYYGSFLLFVLLILSATNRKFIQPLIIASIISIPAIIIALNTPTWIKIILGGTFIQPETIVIRAFIVGAIVIYYEKLLGSLIIEGAVLQALGGMLPQTDHYNTVIIAPLTIIAVIVILSKKIPQLFSKQHTRIYSTIILLILTVHQISFGLEPYNYYDKDKDTIILKQEYDKALYSNTTLTFYPIMLLRNTPNENKDYLKSIGVNTSNENVMSYYCQQGCNHET